MDGEGAPRVRRTATLPLNASCGIAALAAALEPALLEAAGPGAACVSVSLDFAKQPVPGAQAQVEAWVERATRTLVFAAAEARVDGASIGTATAIFSREGAGEGR